MTSEEIIKVLKENISVSDFGYDDFDSVGLGLGSSKEIKRYTGTDGEAYVIRLFSEHNVYLKLNAYFNSYDSCIDFEDTSFEDDLYEVVPYEKTITDYKKV